mmetsp:Transcript_76900/g.89348  ORF Transcript_76900/g.89348 Transcript_76900/m.89348 type:complete len:587 (+) Transcript_76900:20-1780(+)
MTLQISQVATTAFKDQKPGTSGLRKKVSVFQKPHYLANFVQATFNVLKKTVDGIPEVLVLGGDGRYFSKDACQTITKMAAANGVRRVWIGQNGLLSTPAVSAIVRNREGGIAQGAFILTASHNPGGPTEDFGIKYNGANGGPAPEKVTNDIFKETLTIESYLIAEVPEVDLKNIGVAFSSSKFSVEIISSTEDYVALLSQVFDFSIIQKLLKRSDFTFIVDAMHGVAGPYAQRVFVDLLGAHPSCLLNSVPLEDFGKGHPDPNLTYAHELVERMGLQANGDVNPHAPSSIPAFGAAFDGDADRNMILGEKFFVTPSDSVAIIAANSNAIPFFAIHGGVKSVARSMPTSGALDRVASALGLTMAEVPTGWKFFGNLMDSKDLYEGKDYNPLICGEESFGTGSNHVREKDGLWAVLAWLSIIARFNESSKTLISVQEIVEQHWKKFGRNFYCRYDYEGVTTESADQVMTTVRSCNPATIPMLNGSRCVKVDDFEYLDPVDGSISPNQGVRVIFEDGSRFVLRLSGTGSSGATIRLYMEQYMEPSDVIAHVENGSLPSTSEALKELVAISLQVSNLHAATGRHAPTVIT